MADLSITSANVEAKVGATVLSGTAGAAIVPGNVLYLDSDAGTLKLADATSAGSVAKATAVGVAISTAASGNLCYYVSEGPMDIGASVVVGDIYVCSGANAGGMATETGTVTATLEGGDYFTVVGHVIATDTLYVKIYASGVTHA